MALILQKYLAHYCSRVYESLVSNLIFVWFQTRGLLVNNYLIMKVCVGVFLVGIFLVFLVLVILFFKISICCVLSKFSAIGF